MTAPYAPSQTVVGPPALPLAESPDDTPAGLIAAVAALLLIGGAWLLLARAVTAVFRRFGVPVDPAAVAAVVRLTDQSTNHLPRMRGRSDVARGQQRLEASYRAAYIVRAARRVTRDLWRSATPGSVPPRRSAPPGTAPPLAERHPQDDAETAKATLRRALQLEKVYLEQHRKARAARMDAAAQVAEQAALHGPLLGWHSVIDYRCTPECRAADGTNFDVSDPPIIGWPGTPHGGTCRCTAGAPHPGGGSTNDAVRAFVVGH